MAFGVSFVESVIFMDKENDYRYYGSSTLFTIDSQSSISIFIDDETGKILAVRTYDEGCGAFYLDAESFGKKLAEHQGYKYVDYTQSTNDYGVVYEIKLDTGDGELNLVYAWDYTDSFDSYSELFYNSLTKEVLDEIKKEE